MLTTFVNKNTRGVQNQKLTFTIFTNLELSVQVLLHYTSIVILSDLRLEKCGLRGALATLI